MRHRRRGRTGWCAVGLALVAAMLAQPARAELPALSFQVVGVDGLPVANPHVVVYSLDAVDAPIRWSRGNASGLVTVVVPVDDAAVQQRVASAMPANLFIGVFDRLPGAGEINATYVTTAVNVGGVIPDAPLDLGGVNGKVFGLEPGRTDFVKFDLPGGGEDGGDGGGDPTDRGYDNPDCPYYDMAHSRESYCDLADLPYTSRDTMVPFGNNYGGGREMQSVLRYMTTKSTLSSTAVGVGAAGFAEVNGRVSYVEDVDRQLEFLPVGNMRNERVLLQSKMQRNRRGLCTWGDDGNRYCQLTTTYRTHSVTGGRKEPLVGFHDNYAGPGRDCMTMVPGAWEEGTGAVRDEYVKLELGPDENWGNAVPAERRGLHATTTIERGSSEGKKHVRRWELTGTTYEYYILFVAFGAERYIASLDGGTCPETAPQSAWTHATNTDPEIIPANPDPLPTPTPTPRPTRSYRLCDPLVAGEAGPAPDDVIMFDRCQ